MKSIRTLVLLAAGTLTSLLAMAQSQPNDFTPPTALPEPGSIPLVLLGIVGAALVARFIKRK